MAFGRGGKKRKGADPAQLEAIEDSEGLAHLLGTARDAPTRRLAAASLGRLGGLRATVALKAALNDHDTEVRIEAVDALGNIEGPRAVDALLEALRGADRDVRGAALAQLVRLGDVRVLPVLVEMAGDPRHLLRRAAITALGGFKDPRAVEVLLQAVVEPDRSVSDLAAGALGKVGGRPAVKRLLRVRSPAAMRALGRIGHPSAADGLIQTLGNVRNEVLRVAAADALFAVHRAHPGLRLDVLASTGGDLGALAACGDARAAVPLCGWLFAADAGDRIVACRGLAKLGDSGLLSTIEAALCDPVPEVCRAAADAIQAIDPERSWDPLSETILQHVSRIEELRAADGPADELLASIDFLARLGASLALPTLHGLEDHPDWSVRRATAHAIKALSADRR